MPGHECRARRGAMSVSALRNAAIPGRRVPVVPQFKTLVAMLTAGLGLIPGSIRDSMIVCVLFIGLDTLAGVYLAARCGHIRSRKMREQFVAKLTQYGLIIGLGGGAALISKTNVVLQAAFGAVIAIEVVSIIEKVLLLEKCGGAPLGPARPFLRRIEKFFAVVESPSNPGEKGVGE